MNSSEIQVKIEFTSEIDIFCIYIQMRWSETMYISWNQLFLSNFNINTYSHVHLVRVRSYNKNYRTQQIIKKFEYAQKTHFCVFFSALVLLNDLKKSRNIPIEILISNYQFHIS